MAIHKQCQNKKQMGNLLSIHAEIFLKRNSNGRVLTPIETVTKLLENLNGHSYNGYPIIIKENGDLRNLSYRISYIDKMEPRSLIRFYENNHKFVERIFARTYDETGDWDYMISFPNSSNDYYEMRKKCKYSFDRIKYKIGSNTDFEEFEISGIFNSQSALNLQRNRNLVNIPIEYLNSLVTYSDLEIKSEKENELERVLNESNYIIFMDEGITVHQKIEVNEYRKIGPLTNPSDFMAIKYNNSMYDIFSSGWSNCADEEYLEYINKIEKKSTSNKT